MACKVGTGTPFENSAKTVGSRPRGMNQKQATKAGQHPATQEQGGLIAQYHT